MVRGLGGPGDLMERAEEYFPVAEVRMEVTARESGWVARMETRDLGMAVVELGGGRMRAEEGIDYSVGLSDFVQLGDRLESGDPLCVIHARCSDDAERAAQRVREAIVLQEKEVGGQPVVYEIVEKMS